MTGRTVRKWKPWLVWQDGEMEQWFERQAAAGWHLLGTNSLCIHTFVRGAPADMLYRWDVSGAGLRTQYRAPEYVQLLEDAGWEHVAHASNWHCWRKPRAAGLAADIFTDAEGRVAKYKLMQRALWMVMGAGSGLLLLVALVSPGEFSKGVLVGGVIGGVSSGLLGMVALARRIRAVRRS